MTGRKSARNQGLSVQFTIRSLMIAVMVVALIAGGLVAVPWDWRVPGLMLSFPCLALIGAVGLVFRRQRKAAAIWFGTVAASINVLYAAVCICPDSYLLTAASLAWFFMVIPVIVSLGAAWASLATKDTAAPRRSPDFAGLLIFALTVAPLTTLLTLWPLHLVFLGARPAMDHLANQAVAGRPFGGPRWIGVFRLADVRVDPVTGEVALLSEPNPSHPAGFVREGIRAPGGGGSATIAGSNLRLNLWGRWSFREDD